MDFLQFMQAIILPLREAHPDFIRLDGRPGGGNRADAGRFFHAGRVWVVHADTHFRPLMRAYESALRGEDPFLVREIRGGLRLDLKDDLWPEPPRHLYVYLVS